MRRDPDESASSISSHSRSENLEKPSVTTIAHRHMDDLWWRTEKQYAIVKLHVLAHNDEIFCFSSLPNLRISRFQQIKIEQMFGVATTRFQPHT